MNNLIEYKCEKCKKIFWNYPSCNSKFCSQICYRAQLKGRKMPWLKEYLHSPRSEAHKKAIRDGHKKGEESKAWKGGKIKNSNGYIMIYKPNHPFGRRLYVLEHRLVMEKYIGRYLLKNELIHHINGKNDDNRLSNLKIVIINHHYSEITCPKCNFKFLIK